MIKYLPFLNRRSMRRCLGFSVLEIMATLCVAAIITKVVVSNLKELKNPLADAGFQVSHFLRLVRSRAIAQTISVTVTPASTTRLIASGGTSCSGASTAISGLNLNLPTGTRLTSTSWSACFTQRGLANSNVSFSLTDSRGRQKTVEIALGGGVQIR